MENPDSKIDAPTNIPTFSPKQATDLARWAVEDGHMTPEQAAEALKADGMDPAMLDAKPGPPDPFPVGRLHDYYIPVPPDVPMEGEVFARVQQAQGWLHTSGFTKEIGNALAGDVDRVHKMTEKMTENERRLWGISEQINLERMWGPEKAYERIDLARQLIDELEAKSPGLKALLEETGAGNSSFLIAHLAMQAERILEKKK